MDDSISKRKQSSKTSFHSSICDFPRDVLINIFCKLPTITILNCKRVCREFRNTISDPDFAEAHYNPATSRLSVISHNRIQWGENDSLINWMEGYDKPRITGDKKRHLDYKIGLLRFNVGGVTSRCPYEVVNSCRGFLLLRSENADRRNEDFRLYVYNPLTSEHLKLPCLKTIWWRISLLGLGFGAITKKYKVVCASRCRLSCTVNICVHTVGTNVWRGVETNEVSWGLLLPLIPGFGNQALAMNGVVHWPLQHICKIGCFDIDKEEVNAMAMPHFENNPAMPINIGMIHGMLSLSILVGNDCDYSEIWVMRNYGEQESWTKYVVLKNRDVADKRILDFNPKLVGVRDNGEMMVLPDYGLCQIALYDSKGECFEWLREGSSDMILIPHIYIPSFLSIMTRNTAKFQATANHVASQ